MLLTNHCQWFIKEVYSWTQVIIVVLFDLVDTRCGCQSYTFQSSVPVLREFAAMGSKTIGCHESRGWCFTHLCANVTKVCCPAVETTDCSDVRGWGLTDSQASSKSAWISNIGFRFCLCRCMSCVCSRYTARILHRSTSNYAHNSVTFGILHWVFGFCFVCWTTGMNVLVGTSVKL